MHKLSEASFQVVGQYGAAKGEKTLHGIGFIIGSQEFIGGVHLNRHSLN